MSKIIRKNKSFLGALNLCLLMTLLVGALFFIKSMDDLMTKNLELDNLKAKLVLLEEKKGEMESQKNNLESYENISSRLNDLSMIKISNIDYISLGDDSLAKK